MEVCHDNRELLLMMKGSFAMSYLRTNCLASFLNSISTGLCVCACERVVDIIMSHAAHVLTPSMRTVPRRMTDENSGSRSVQKN